jgi:hypothetical protein
LSQALFVRLKLHGIVMRCIGRENTAMALAKIEVQLLL